MRPVIHVGTDTKTRTPSADPAQSNPPRKGEPTRLIPNVLLNVTRTQHVPDLLKYRASPRAIIRAASRREK